MVTRSSLLFAAASVLALSALLAPVASAQISYCNIQGPTTGECATPTTFVATVPIQPNTPFGATWSLLNNNAGASFVGGNTCVNVTSCSVVVTTTQVGSVVVRVLLSLGGGVFKSCQKTFTVTDNSPPVITCPPNATVPCNTSVDPSVTGTPTTSAECGPVTLSYVDVNVGGGGNCGGGVIYRTWTATDSVGHSANCLQTITFSGGAPTITCPGPVTVPCFSQVPAPNIGSVVATDPCSSGLTVAHVSDTASNGTSSCNNVISRVYSATNGCGLVASCTQTITVNDTTPPSLICPFGAIVPCFSQIPAPSPTAVIATDDCGGPVMVTHLGDTATSGTSSCLNTVTRTYQGVDACGNVATCTQLFTANDTTGPMLTCPGPAAFQCFSQIPPPDLALVGATDNCGGVVPVTYLGDFATNGTSSCMNVVTRTYAGVDACGNAGVCSQVFTINDTTPPSITCPGPVAVQCFSLVPPPAPLSVITSDNCGGIPTVIHLGDSFSNGTSSCNNVVTRTYQATDACGNTATCTQMITVNDTTPPSITCPGPVAVQCFSLVPPPAPLSVITSDNCGGIPTVIHLGDSFSNGTSSCNNVVTRTYQATDACGNQATCTQMITVNDTTPPSITCPGPVAVQCFSLVPPPAPLSVITSDNCGGIPTVIHLGDSFSNGTSSCNNVITRAYQSTDACGNTATCTQIITVNDTTNPTLTCPGPAAFQCFSQIPAASATAVTATDNCGGAVVVTHLGDSATSGTSNCLNVITRTYQGTDPCGNVGLCSQVFTVNDTNPPSITCPGALSFQCFSQIPTPTPGLIATSDNCGGPVMVVHLGDSATNGTSSCNNVITRTYQATDSCGNVNTCTQTITINDNVIPTVTCAPPQAVQCIAQIPPPDPSTVTASNACGGPVTVVHVSDVPANGASNCLNTITRTYQATDACGNPNTCTQVFLVNDTTPPVITCPGPLSFQCFSQVPPANPALVTTTDNCGGLVLVNHVGDSATNGTSSCNNVITRIYIAVDSCGNTATCTQVITVNDTTAPVITCPVDFTGPCGSPTDPGTTGTATATDNCNLTPVISFTDVMTGGPCPSFAETITRTWTANDGCNTVSCVQIITLTPSPPVSAGCTFDLVGGCGFPTPLLTATFQTFTITPMITGADPNTQLVLAAQVPPYGAFTTLAAGCFLHLSPSLPPTAVIGSFQTDASGSWSHAFDIPPYPSPVRAILQAATASTNPGPLGNNSLSNAIEIWRPCPPCTYRRLDWALPVGPAAALFDAEWINVFSPLGMDIGLYAPANGATPPNGIHWTPDVAGRTALKTFIQGIGGLPNALSMDAINATTSNSGTLGRLTAVLRMNIRFNQAGFLGETNPGFGNFVYVDPGDSLHGLTVNQILLAADQVVAGAFPPPPGYTFNDFGNLLERLSVAFQDCSPDEWTGQHLSFP